MCKRELNLRRCTSANVMGGIVVNLFLIFCQQLQVLWQTFLPAASVNCISPQSDVVFACDVAEHLQALSSCKYPATLQAKTTSLWKQTHEIQQLSGEARMLNFCIFCVTLITRQDVVAVRCLPEPRCALRSRLCDKFSGLLSPTSTTWYQETCGQGRGAQW